MNEFPPGVVEKFNGDFVDKMLADNLAKTWVELTSQLAEAKAENEQLRKALQFYADPKTWESEWDSQFKTRVPNHDSGLTARVALKEKSDG